MKLEQSLEGGEEESQAHVCAGASCIRERQASYRPSTNTDRLLRTGHYTGSAGLGAGGAQAQRGIGPRPAGQTLPRHRGLPCRCCGVLQETEGT